MNWGDETMGRRTFLRLGVAAAAAGGVYATCVEPRWLRVTEISVPTRRLPEAFHGFRIAQLTDLHFGPFVDRDAVRTAFEKVSELEVDFLALTGDLVSGEARTWAPELADLIAGVPTAHGAAAVFGNHDYRLGHPNPSAADRESAETIGGLLRDRGVAVLENDAIAVWKGSSGLLVAGADDLWSGRCMPERALRDASPEMPAILLCHNPDTADDMAGLPVDLTLAGHTHGGQVRIPLFGVPFVPIANKRYVHGMFELSERNRMYVNAGVGSFYRVRFNVRPELAVFTLAPA